jgi:signal transduction histidine kinase
MNPLLRFTAIALFVILTALVGLLAVPAWQGTRPETTETRAAAAGPAAESTPTTPSRTRLLALTQRAALFLAVIGLALTFTLIVSQAFRPSRSSDTRPPYAAARAEVSTLAKLAESSVAQGAELSRERDVRRRAEEDARLKQQLLAQSLDEKIRLGRDLHDGIIQSLYAAGLALESVRALVKEDPDEAERRLEQTRASLNGAIRDVRTYIVGLAPENLRRAGFAQALTGLLGELRAGRAAEFDMQIDDAAAASLTPEQSIEALQIAREAVSNALRHGGATRITLRMHRTDQELCLLVQDNGAGFDATQERPGGFGLGNMRARAEQLGADLRITSQPGQGTRVLATLPILRPTAVQA